MLATVGIVATSPGSALGKRLASLTAAFASFLFLLFGLDVASMRCEIDHL